MPFSGGKPRAFNMSFRRFISFFILRLHPIGFNTHIDGAAIVDMIEAISHNKPIGQANQPKSTLGKNFMAIRPIASSVMITSWTLSHAVNTEV